MSVFINRYHVADVGCFFVRLGVALSVYLGLMLEDEIENPKVCFWTAVEAFILEGVFRYATIAFVATCAQTAHGLTLYKRGEGSGAPKVGVCCTSDS